MKKHPTRNGEQGGLAEINSIYHDLAARPQDRNCTLQSQCCRFHLTGKVPSVTRGEALVAAKAWRASGRKTLPESANGSCEFLDPRTAKCLIYDGRPFGCRTHFCQAAGGPYSRSSVLDLIRRLEAVDAALGGDGPRSMPSALRAINP